MLKSFLKDESGATAIEYALIAAILAIGIIAALSTLRQELNETFGSVSNQLNSAQNNTSN